MKIDLNTSHCRWMLFTKNNKVITENIARGVTWKKVYKEEFGNIKAVCFQLIPSGKKIFVPEGEDYWSFEEFIAMAGQTVPTHTKRGICSLENRKLGLWNVILIENDGKWKKEIMTCEEIGYDVRNYINAQDKERNRKWQ